MNATLRILAITVVAASCASQHERGEADPVPDPPKERERKDGAKATTDSVPAYMLQHFAELAGIESDLVAGNLRSARAHAANLLKARPGEPDEWQQYRAPLATAAQAISASKALTDAAAHTADVVRACAGCHRGLAVAPTSKPVLSLPPSATVAEKMRLHRVAIDALRTSLLFDDDALWKSGVTMLSHAPLDPKEAVGPGVINPEFVERASAVRGCASLAKQRTGTERFAIYGALLTTCVACHSKSTEPAKLHTCK